MDIKVATAENGGLNFIFQQAYREGWEPGLKDTTVFSSVDPNGFFIGIVNGKIVGCISAVKFLNYGFVGYYVVLPEERGHGYGLQLFQHGMRYLGTVNTGLDGVPEQVSNYRKSGFKAFHLNVRFRGIAQHTTPVLVSGTTNNEIDGIISMACVDRHDLMTYDRAHYPAERDNWVNQWIDGSIEGSYSLVSVENGTVVGVAVMRPSVNGYRVGPWYANTPIIATALLNALISKMPEGGFYFVDVPDVNAGAVTLVESMNLEKLSGGCRRMYTVEEPAEINWSQIYGVSSLELG